MNFNFLNETFWGNTWRDYLIFLALLLLGLLFRKISARLIARAIRPLFGEFGKQIQSNVFINLLSRPVSVVFFFVLCYLAINQLDYPFDITIFSRRSVINGQKMLYNWTLRDAIDKICRFFTTLGIFWTILRMIDFTAIVFSQKSQMQETQSKDQLVPFMKELGKVIVIMIGVLVVLGWVFRINITALITGLGVGGLVMGLAAKETLENFLGSLSILIYKPFVVGDLVKIENGGYEGTIEKVGFRSTVMRTLDKTLVTIPNKKMVDGVLENLTLRNQRRVKFLIKLNPQTSTIPIIRQVAKEIKDYLDAHPAANNDPLVAFDFVETISYNIQVMYFLENTNFNSFILTREEIYYQIVEIVQKNQTDFAFKE